MKCLGVAQLPWLARIKDNNTDHADHADMNSSILTQSATISSASNQTVLSLIE